MLSRGITGLKQYMHEGVFETIGATPFTKNLDAGSATWRFLGKELITQEGRSGFKIGGSYEMGAWERPMTALQIGMTGFAALGGYAEGGVGGALGAVATDLAVNSALAKHGYEYKKDAAGITRAVSKWNMGSRMLRYGVAMGLAGAASNAVGGGVLGFAAGLGAASIGIRGGIGMVGAYASYQAARFTGHAVGGVLKAGYQHRQMQKSIQTSGSMAAFNTQGAHTMRQRAVQAIHKSHLNARSALGSEAQYMHYPSKNYHSRYRGAY